MKEIEPDDQFAAVRQAVVNQRRQGPTEAELVTISLLMRIYDVQMALLSLASKELADEIHDGHAEGKSFNPQMFIPALEEFDVDEDAGPVA